MPDLPITRLEDVGEETIAVKVETPADFAAYLVLVRATSEGEEEPGYYTISSPDVEDRFEMTVAVNPEGTLGLWLAERVLGEEITVEGPFGDIQYTGERSTLVFVSGPGTGPAVGIAERAGAAGHDATIVYGGSHPPHRARLAELEEQGATVVLSNDLDAAVESLVLSAEETYVFGFGSFVEAAREALAGVGHDPDDAEIESFGPK